jgi:hypothetical protein
MTSQIEWMQLQIEKLNAEISDLKALNKKLADILRHSFPERSGYYFICGGSEINSTDGLPESIEVCPAYGSDIVGLYKKVHVSAPEW